MPADPSVGTDERGLAMIITCENCETSFNLNEKLLKPMGSKVRCSRCKHLFTAYPPALPEQEQAVVETEASEEIEEKIEAAEAPEPESTSEDTGGMAADTMESESSQEVAGDLFAQEIEEADAPESAGEETPFTAQEEMDEVLDDLDLESDIDTVSEENDVAAEIVADDVDDGQEAPSEELTVDFADEADVTDEAQTSAEVQDVLEEMELPGLEESFDREPAADGTLIEDDVLEDLDLELDVTPEEEISVQEDTTDEALDLSDIEMSMESEPEIDSDEDELDLDLDLDLDLVSEPETDAGLTEDEDDMESEELDFSDFEETVMLDSSPKPETGSVSDDLGEDLELELDLEMADDVVPDVEPELPSMEKEGVELEDLDFELEMELEGEAADGTENEDVDLSDIEKMLDMDGKEAETISLVSDLDDVETEVEKWKESPDADDLMDQTGEIDLSDIMIDADDDDLEGDIEDVELELDLDEVSELVLPAGGEREPEKIDISGFDDYDIPEEEELTLEHINGGDIELEFEVDGETDDLDSMATVSDVEEIGVGAKTIALAATQENADEDPAKKKEEKKKTKKIKPARKSGILRPVVLLLLLILLPLTAVVLLDRFMGMDVPYVTEYLKQVPYLKQVMSPEMKESGEISVDNISSKFVDNTAHGKLFVITGTVKNEFSESRKYIKIQGTLFSAGKILAKEATVYGGNVLSDQDLSEMSLTDIDQRLSDRFGDNKSNFDVKPGMSIPFMVVFSDLPESLEEFTIEIAGSFPVTTQQ